MISFPNAKINLGLNILRKRNDGYHDISSCLYPIPLKDVLEIVPKKEFTFINTGLTVDHDRGDNLCIKAYQLVQDAYGIPAVSIHLHKLIPMGAGLGGGSADAAFTLKALDILFELNMGTEKLKQFSAALGSDCPFFIENVPVLATGTGTELSKMTVNLQQKYILLVFPDFSMSTSKAYAGINPAIPDVNLVEVLSGSPSDWRDLMKNDFETSLFSEYPQLEKIKDDLYKKGAFYAAMSGSGSTMFGLFDERPDPLQTNYTSVVLQL